MDPITALLIGLAVAGGGYAAFKKSRPTAQPIDPNAALLAAGQKAAAEAQKFFRSAGGKLNKFGSGTARQARRNYEDVVNAPVHAAQDVNKAAKHAEDAAKHAAKKLRKKLHI